MSNPVFVCDPSLAPKVFAVCQSCFEQKTFAEAATGEIMALIAIAIEAQSAETARLSPKGESAGAKHIAQTDPDQSINSTGGQ